MALRYIRAFNTGNISDGAYKEIEWKPTEKVHIKWITISERSSKTLDNTQIYVSIPGWVFTRDFSPGLLWGHSQPYLLPFERDIEAGTRVYVKVTNNEGETINVDVCFYVEEVS